MLANVANSSICICARVEAARNLRAMASIDLARRSSLSRYATHAKQGARARTHARSAALHAARIISAAQEQCCYHLVTHDMISGRIHQ
eukprot:1736574-Pleurochrysis_carterae.AAC.1